MISVSIPYLSIERTEGGGYLVAQRLEGDGRKGPVNKHFVAEDLTSLLKLLKQLETPPFVPQQPTPTVR